MYIQSSGNLLSLDSHLNPSLFGEDAEDAAQVSQFWRRFQRKSICLHLKMLRSLRGKIWRMTLHAQTIYLLGRRRMEQCHTHTENKDNKAAWDAAFCNVKNKKENPRLWKKKWSSLSYTEIWASPRRHWVLPTKIYPQEAMKGISTPGSQLNHIDLLEEYFAMWDSKCPSREICCPWGCVLPEAPRLEGSLVAEAHMCNQLSLTAFLKEDNTVFLREEHYLSMKKIQAAEAGESKTSMWIPDLCNSWTLAERRRKEKPWRNTNMDVVIGAVSMYTS